MRVLIRLFVVLTAVCAAVIPRGVHASAFSEPDLMALLAKNPATGRPIASITELLPLLPRELRSNFTLVYHSRSPFKAAITPRYPRVILFSDDAHFVLTFTGDPGKPGADIIETMTFDDETATFALRAYQLSADEEGARQPSMTTSACGSCHGTDPRPIYDSYPLWPGFYGSVLDTFPHDKLGRAEQKTYMSFLATTAKIGVYAGLFFHGGSPTTPFLDPKTISSDTVELDPGTFEFLPNTRLGMAFTELNRKRIYRKLANGPGFSANEKRILADLLECHGADVPGRGALRATRSRVTRENIARLRRLGTGPSDPDPGLHRMQELDLVRELTELQTAAALAGVDSSDWSMAMGEGSLAFFDGILSGMHRGRSYYLKEDLIFELLAHLAKREAAFRAFFFEDAVYALDGYPFGHRIDLGRALASCRLLVPPNRPSTWGRSRSSRDTPRRRPRQRAPLNLSLTTFMSGLAGGLP